MKSLSPKTRYRFIVVLFIACCAALLGVALFAGSPPPGRPAAQPLTLRGGLVVGNHMNTKNWTFRYKNATLSPDGTLATVDGLKNGVLYRDGKPFLSLNAQHATVNTQTFDFTAVGDVHVAQLSGTMTRSFDTDYIQWINATKTLTLPHTSVIRTGDQVLRVASVKVDFNRSNIHLGKVTGGIIP